MGARFEALFTGVLRAVSDLGCIFFRILSSGFEQCVIEDTPDGRVELAVLTLLSMCWTLFGIKKVCVVY